jgi:glucosamine--fructose-6-phosphate aminotransferase (isomerizing)
VALATPSLFSIYNKPPILKDFLVIGISQSGESPDLIAVIDEANKQGSETVVITNHPESPLGRKANFTIDIQAGPELAIAATKSYTAQLGAIAMLSAAWSNQADLWKEIRQLPELMHTVLNTESQIKEFSTRYRYMDQCVVLGRGYNYATAFEWSLKLKELTYVVAQPYSSADFLHGPIAMVSDGFPIFAVVTQGKVFEEIAQLLQRLIQNHGADLFIISDTQDILDIADCPIHIPKGIPEWLSPMVSIIPAQLFSYYLTIAKRIDPDAPRGLSKVTRTT